MSSVPGQVAEQSADMAFLDLIPASASEPRQPPGELPEVLAGRWRLDRLLGVGGMGAVYQATDLLRQQLGEPDPEVAIKVLSREFAEYQDAALLLHAEFALLARLRHRHVVRAASFELEPASRNTFMVLELLQGRTLDDLLSVPLQMSWSELRELGLQLCSALGHAHRHGVLHGDIKPGNLMLGDDGLMLFDFGLGLLLEQGGRSLPKLSRQRFAAWTPGYVAPEILQGGELTGAADIYAAACVLYELAAGQPPQLGEGGSAYADLASPGIWPAEHWGVLKQALHPQPQRRASLAALEGCFSERRRGWMGRWLARLSAA